MELGFDQKMRVKHQLFKGGIRQSWRPEGLKVAILHNNLVQNEKQHQKQTSKYNLNNS